MKIILRREVSDVAIDIGTVDQLSILSWPGGEGRNSLVSLGEFQGVRFCLLISQRPRGSAWRGVFSLRPAREYRIDIPIFKVPGMERPN